MVVERSFGDLENRWPRHINLQTNIEFANKIIAVCCCHHIICIEHGDINLLSLYLSRTDTEDRYRILNFTNAIEKITNYILLIIFLLNFSDKILFVLNFVLTKYLQLQTNLKIM